MHSNFAQIQCQINYGSQRSVDMDTRVRGQPCPPLSADTDADTDILKIKISDTDADKDIEIFVTADMDADTDSKYFSNVSTDMDADTTIYYTGCTQCATPKLP